MCSHSEDEVEQGLAKVGSIPLEACCSFLRDIPISRSTPGLPRRAAAHDGEPEPIHIEETDTALTVECEGSHRIEAAASVFVDRKIRGMSHLRLPNAEAGTALQRPPKYQIPLAGLVVACIVHAACSAQ